MQREQEINFFQQSKDNINQLAKKVDKKPFFKLAFLTVAFGCFRLLYWVGCVFCQ